MKKLIVKNCRKPKPWETRDFNYQEWGKMEYDWTNESKINNSVRCYFFEYDNFIKGKKNEHILKSTFGRKSVFEIEYSISLWFKKCIGAYNEIQLK